MLLFPAVVLVALVLLVVVPLLRRVWAFERRHRAGPHRHGPLTRRTRTAAVVEAVAMTTAGGPTVPLAERTRCCRPPYGLSCLASGEAPV